jgi:GDP-L-fucose synthase
LILGGHGFVGSSVRSLLEAGGDEVIAISRRDGVDFTDYGATRRAIADAAPDAIINCAAHVGSLHYVTTYAADVIHDNVAMALNLYRAVADVVPAARIVNPLSNCSYPGDADIQREEEWLDGPVHKSVHSYGYSKRMIQELAECYRMQHGVRSVNFLVPNTFGPGDHIDPNKTHALNGMIIRMLKAHRADDESFEIWGTGAPVREWAYIADVAEILQRGLTIGEELTYPVNIAQNRGYSIAETAGHIARAIGFEGRLTFNTAYQDGAPTKILDDRRFRELFPGFTFIDHEEGIGNTVKYYQSVL